MFKIAAKPKAKENKTASATNNNGDANNKANEMGSVTPVINAVSAIETKKPSVAFLFGPAGIALYIANATAGIPIIIWRYRPLLNSAKLPKNFVEIGRAHV